VLIFDLNPRSKGGTCVLAPSLESGSRSTCVLPRKTYQREA